MKMTCYIGIATFMTTFPTTGTLIMLDALSRWGWILHIIFCLCSIALQYTGVPYVIRLQNIDKTNFIAMSVLSVSDGEQSGQGKFMHWTQIVSTSYGYELFINHLEREYSVENLLFITEVCVYVSMFCFFLSG